MIKAVHVGEQFPDLTHNSHLLPVDTAVSTAPTGHEVWNQTAPRVWEHSGVQLDPYYLNTQLYLRALPEMEVVELPPVTASEYRWRLRDSALGAAERAGVRISPVLEMCRQFGADQPRLTPGGVVCSRTDLDRLPVGSIYYSAHPDRPNLMNVWEKSEAGHTLVLGQNPTRPNGSPVTIYSMPTDVVLPQEEPADDLTLATIALKAWRVGNVYKKRNSWCSVFENTLAALGISDKALALTGGSPKGPGDELDREGAALLPEGSLLWWSWQNKTAAAVYVRDNTARNRSRTKRVWGYEDDGDNSHDRMIVVQTPDEGITWTVSGALLRHMPDEVEVMVSGQPRLVRNIREDVDPWRVYTIAQWVA